MKYLGLIIAMGLVGCATSRTVVYEVESAPAKALIEVDGNVLCDSTPCKLELECKRAFVGLANAPGGYQQTSDDYRVEAIPIERTGEQQYSSRKLINPCTSVDTKNPRLKFYIDRAPHAPVQTIINK